MLNQKSDFNQHFPCCCIVTVYLLEQFTRWWFQTNSVIFTPKVGEAFQFYEHIFQMGRFNHQPDWSFQAMKIDRLPKNCWRAVWGTQQKHDNSTRCRWGFWMKTKWIVGVFWHSVGDFCWLMLTASLPFTEVESSPRMLFRLCRDWSLSKDHLLRSFNQSGFLAFLHRISGSFVLSKTTSRFKIFYVPSTTRGFAFVEIEAGNHGNKTTSISQLVNLYDIQACCCCCCCCYYYCCCCCKLKVGSSRPTTYPPLQIFLL